MTTVSYRALTKQSIKEQLLNNLWTILGVVMVAPILALLQWLLGNSINFEVNGFTFLDGITRGTVPWIPAGSIVVGAIVAFSAWIISITNAATARTYLGAGMSRRAIFLMNLWVWLASALFMALLAALAMLGHFISTGDFSGDLSIDLTAAEGVNRTFEATPGILWFAPAVMFLAMVYAHAAGYFVSMLFVRLPWWIPVCVATFLVIVLPLIFGVDGDLFAWWYNRFLEFSNPMLTFTAQTLFDSVIFVGLSWLMLRRLPIRR